jgi:Cu/Ag efflux pump CusA
VPLPEVAEAMVAMEQHFDRLEQLAAGDWQPLPRHPDLKPAHEALLLREQFTELLRSHGVPLRQAIIEAGRTRMTPVLLTASATILGLIPLAIGLNIDFATMFTNLNPHIFMGGDSVAFWGPLSWTMIFGLSFATFLTLILVPAMYLLNEQIKKKVFGWFGKNYDPDANTQPDALEKLDI